MQFNKIRGVGKQLLVAIFAFSWVVCTAQNEIPVQVLDEIQISTTRLSQFAVGNKVGGMDSVLLAVSSDQNLSDLLARHSPVYIKSYGLGGLATPSFRGSGSSHTPIIWNGFNLQSPLNGQVDFSLIPAYLIEDLSLQYGGGGALYGSGAIGGAIHIDRSTGIKPGVTAAINLGAGSFGNMVQGLRFGYGDKDKWATSVKFFHRSVDNDFPFENSTKAGSPTVRQTNAALEQIGVINDYTIQVGEKSQLDLGIWYQWSDRGIPPTMTQSSSAASQEDESIRFSGQFKGSSASARWAVRSAILDETNEFRDPGINLVSLNKSTAWVNEFEMDGELGELYSWNLGFHWANYHGESANLGGSVTQNRVAAFGSAKASTTNGKIMGVLSLRQELFDGQPGPMVPTLGIELIPSSDWLVRGSLTRNYRIPTFNDLYWSDSFARGNPDLGPESGWSQDASIEYNRRFQNLTLGSTFGLFNSHIDNWILWSPDSVGVWSPTNVLNVQSRGAEVAIELRLSLSQWHLALKPQYNYVRATNQQVLSGSESSLGKQLIYVPKHNAQIYLSIGYGPTRLSYDHSFTGITYTTSDNSNFLPAYGVGNLIISSEIHFLGLEWHLTGEVRNLWNQEYQVIAFRPMPLRYYQVGLSLLFRNLKS